MVMLNAGCALAALLAFRLLIRPARRSRGASVAD
jgi:hypothetical protein